MSPGQDIPPEICYSILEYLLFEELAAVYAALPGVWRECAYTSATDSICSYLSNGLPGATCVFSTTGLNLHKTLPHSTRFKYRNPDWIPDFHFGTTGLSIDGNSLQMTTTLPKEDQSQPYQYPIPLSCRGLFEGNGKNEPYEMKRICLSLQAPDNLEAMGGLYLVYSIANIPTSEPRVDDHVEGVHRSTTISHYLQLDQLAVSPHGCLEYALMHSVPGYIDWASLPIEWGYILGTTIFASISFDIRDTKDDPILRSIQRSQPFSEWVMNDFKLAWSLSPELALSFQTRLKHQVGKTQISVPGLLEEEEE
jgi:hypothetical protein